LLKLEVEGVSEVCGIVDLYDAFPAVCWEPCGVLLQQYIYEKSVVTVMRSFRNHGTSHSD